MARSAIILTFHLKIIASRNDHGDSVHIPLLFISEKYKNTVAVVAKLSQESRVPDEKYRERERERDNRPRFLTVHGGCVESREISNS